VDTLKKVLHFTEETVVEREEREGRRMIGFGLVVQGSFPNGGPEERERAVQAVLDALDTVQEMLRARDYGIQFTAAALRAEEPRHAGD
jgi:hypothetical protein